MKFETLMLRGLFVACFAVCALIMGAMLNARPQTLQQAAAGPVASVLLAAPSVCAMKPDGVVCPAMRG
jgi:hypothetical protein